MLMGSIMRTLVFNRSELARGALDVSQNSKTLASSDVFIGFVLEREEQEWRVVDF